MGLGRARWLCSDGRFRLDERRAWTVVDPATAARRLRGWLELHGLEAARLQRLRLVPVAQLGCPGIHVLARADERGEPG